MKVLFSIAILLIVHPCVFSQADEEELIKNVIIKQTAAYFACDAVAWENTYSGTDYISRAVTDFNNPGSAATGKGLQFINRMKLYLNSEACKQSTPRIQYSEWNIQVRGDMAWATVKARTTMKDETEIDAYETRVLEKLGGVWKISAISSVWDFNHASKPWKPNNASNKK